MLGKTPGFTTIALITLALGIGATAAIFSVVDAVLLRSLPYRDPSRLVMIYEDISKDGFPHNTPAPANYAEWKKQPQLFQDVAAMRLDSFNLTAPGEHPEQRGGASITWNLFPVLGVQPVLGRLLTSADDLPGAHKVAVIGHALWMQRFGGDPSLIGRDIFLNGEKYAVVGIMPRGFVFPTKESEIWTPIAFTPEQLADHGSHYLTVIGRLQPGITLTKANAQLSVLAKRMSRDFPDNPIDNFFAEPLQYSYTRDVRQGLILLFAAVGFILLIACANIANLLLSRSAVRSREIAVRTALGASRSRIVRQLLTESILLSAGGGLAGIMLAVWCFNFLASLIPADLSQSVALQLDSRMLLFTAAVSLACSVFFGLVPALQIAHVDLNDVLKEGARGNAGPRRKGLRNLLAIGEAALSLMLLVGSGLLLESFVNVRGLDPGYRSDHVLTARLQMANRTFASRTQFFEGVLDRIRSLPGVESVGVTSALPLTWKGGTNSFIPEKMQMKRELTYDANDRVVSPGYFKTMRIPLIRGRLFTSSDGPDAQPVVIINETMARMFWPGQDPIGRRFQPAFEKDTPEFRIIGIVGDVRQMNLSQPARQEMYFDYRQSKDNWMLPRDVVIRTSLDPASLASAVRTAVWSVDPSQPVSHVLTLDQVLDEEVADRRVEAMLLGTLAALALILACVGIYGVMSYTVTQRTQEIGVRVALGANASSVFRTVAGHGLLLTGLGIAIGVGASLALSQLLASLLFGVNATDPLTYAVATGLFVLVAMIACLLPARRAAKVDPVTALRYE